MPASQICCADSLTEPASALSNRPAPEAFFLAAIALSFLTICGSPGVCCGCAPAAGMAATLGKTGSGGHPNLLVRRAQRPVGALLGFAPRGDLSPLHKNRHGRERTGRGAIRGSRMRYFVTGATGFIGKRLVKALLARRGAVVYFLLRPESEDKVAGAARVLGRSDGEPRRAPSRSYGDLTAKKLGVSADDIKKLKGHVDHVYHLAAVYDLSADAESQIAVNIEGTRAVVEFAKAIDAGHLHHVSSIAAAGLLRRRLSRGHVRRGRRPRPPVLHDQAREREDRAQGIEGAVDGVPAGARRRRLAAPARWTRSTARITSSS